MLLEDSDTLEQMTFEKFVFANILQCANFKRFQTLKRCQ